MTGPDRLAKIDALFEAALEVSPEEVEQLLEARADDPELVREVQALLHFDRQGDTIQVSFEAERWALARLEAPQAEAEAGERVGVYRLIEPIARGGMGVVWLGERPPEPFKQPIEV